MEAWMAVENQVVWAQARFTVIAAQCIRLEYAAEGNFIDAPSWVALHRDGEDAAFTVTRLADGVEIHTGAMVLHYRADGRPFHADNLWAVIGGTVTWRFGERNRFNLGGNIVTLDDVTDEIPLSEGLLSRDGWYLLDDSDSCLWHDGWPMPRPAGHGYDGYFFGYGLDYQGALRAFMQLAGRVPLPRKYTLGVWYSRWFSYTAEDYRQIVREFEAHDFPLDIMVMDMEWHTKPVDAAGFGWAGQKGWSGWSWNSELIPEPAALLDWFHQRGLHVTLNVHPHDGIRPHEDHYADFMCQLGYDPGEGKYLPFRAGDRSYMQAYFEQIHRPLEVDGVDFWWVDWQQDSLVPRAVGMECMTHLPLLNYAYYRHSATGGKRGLGLSRWAGWGDHRYPIHFSGDAVIEWRTLAFEIFVTLTAGNVGCFYWSHDIGGFSGKRNPELYVRWVQFGLTTAAMRLHSAGDELDRRPWTWGAENETRLRDMLHWRARLIPVIYSLMYQGYAEAQPLTRPLYLEFPEFDEAYRQRYEYMLGDLFVVAPVTVPVGADGLAATAVWLPPGEWVHWFSGVRLQGPALVEAHSTLEEFPLYVRAGIPVPLAEYAPRMTQAPLAQVELRCYDGENGGEFALYEDDGISEAYTAGAHAVTLLRYRRTAKAGFLTVEAASGSYAGQLSERSWRIELRGLRQKVALVRLNGMEITGQNTPDGCRIDLEHMPVGKSLELEFLWIQ